MIKRIGIAFIRHNYPFKEKFQCFVNVLYGHGFTCMGRAYIADQLHLATFGLLDQHNS
ncbi:hypothetical protein SAMN02787076_00993 [Rhizobacter sp. OV335]|jgi:hypothetical protein|nr:hypothetical protein SAMN02787076_00993 [Rhizobacter sp. OV335]